MNKKLSICLAITTSMALLTGCNAKAGNPTTEDEQIGYSMGAFIGKQLKSQNPNLDLKQFMNGFETAYTGKDLVITEEQMRENLDKMVVKARAEAEKKAKELAEKNQAEAKKFFEENAKKEGVKVDESGLQYLVVKQGEGANPKLDDTVSVDYEGMLLNGEVFDSSYKRGEPATFKLSQVIKGWQIGLQKMQAGAEYMLYIPADLAYGESGAGDKIGPNAALIFKVELKKIEPADQGKKTNKKPVKNKK